MRVKLFTTESEATEFVADIEMVFEYEAGMRYCIPTQLGGHWYVPVTDAIIDRLAIDVWTLYEIDISGETNE